MEDQCGPLSWIHWNQEEGLEELKHSLLYTTLELETTIVSAQEEISRREHDLINLKDVLRKTIMERDEAKQKCQKLEQEKLVLQKQLEEQYQLLWQQEIAPLSGTSASTSEENESRGIDKMITMQTPAFSISQAPPPPPPPVKPLPEKGQLLKAVIEAGPLLKTLLLAAPLPQWQHPPPQLKAIEIPPVIISPSNKRSLLGFPEFSPNKYQRIDQ